MRRGLRAAGRRRGGAQRARAFVRDAYLAVTALLVLLFVSEMFPSLA